MTATVRPTTFDDAASIEAILQSSYPRVMSASYEPKLLAIVLPGMLKANPKLLVSGTFYVAETNSGDAAGCGGWTHDEPGTNVIKPGLAHIRHFATHNNHLKQGIGRLIYERCEKDARAAGVSKFDCFASLNAEDFYRALGFARIKEIEVAFPDNIMFPSVLMRRKI